MNSVDFVILWVDGNDREWQVERSQYKPSLNEDARIQRFRDWDNLQYWFRGVEKYAPWVNKVFFVTWGHYPKWLNLDNPKLRVINHADYMPKQYLPTFNSNSLELNIHRIKDLSEQFVLFNDDMFLISPTKSTDFFKKGLPCDSAALNVHCLDTNFGFNYAMFQAIGVINKYYDFHSSVFKNFTKWFNLKNGKQLLRTLYLIPCPRYPGIYQPHLADSFLKSTFVELWEKEYQLFDETSRHKFRDKLDYSQWTFRNWQLASGQFANRNAKKFGRSFFIEKNRDDVSTVCDFITKQKGKMIAINDGEMTDYEFGDNKKRIIEAFEKILPEKSSFEL